MKVIIDRFEGDFAVVETAQGMLNVPKALFAGAHEGDIVEITVLGKLPPENGEPTPAELFDKLRAKSRRRRKKASADAPSGDTGEPSSDGTIPSSDEQKPC